ncbi:GNAT family N-acetyltransferase [Rossellomorea sp. GCM10028870]|uniref:GNAT family N-acetyltransferase n=1 Tax=Rossellomorea sp. GCM10028870 TaxID=3273426 RepID=UPI003618AB5B
MVNSVQLELIKPSDRSLYLPYLLLADESEKIVKQYMNAGDMYSICYGINIAGVVLFTFHSKQVVELKNIALDTAYRSKGIGKLVLNEACENYRRKGLHKMIVGTANSSIGNLAFYQKAGFRMAEIKRDFFKDYPEPIFEDGIRALDMVMFEKELINY